MPTNYLSLRNVRKYVSLYIDWTKAQDKNADARVSGKQWI